MDLTAFAKDLALDFTELRLEHGGGALYLPAAPVDVSYLASDHFPDHCDDDNAYEVLRSAAGMEELITFEWDEGNGSPFHVILETLRLEDRAYVTLPPDDAVDQPWEAFVAVENPDATEILDALYFDLMWDNGESYSVELFSTLPTKIRSVALGKETVRAGFHLYLDWDETRSPGAWINAAHIPEWMRKFDELAAAADILLEADTEINRDIFIEAYIDATYQT